MVSQAIMGTPVKILKKSGSWLLFRLLIIISAGSAGSGIVKNLDEDRNGKMEKIGQD